VDNSSPDFGPHYGQSFLYLTYFLDRFGEEATKALTNNPANDLTSVDDTLAQLNITDPQTGKLITADDVFIDWAVALHLMDGSVGDGRYHYKNYPNAPQVTTSELISSCPQSSGGSVNQYGMDYYTINCAGNYTLHFTGSTIAGLLPVDAHSGNYSFWSNRGDESDMTLTHEFDFTNVSAPISMSFAMWYDIETDYDYVLLEAGTDGERWQILTTPSGTGEDPQAIRMAGDTTVKPMTGSPKKSISQNLQARRCRSDSNTLPTRRLTAKAFYWMTFRSTRSTTSLILKRMMEAGRLRDSHESKTFFRRPIAWLSLPKAIPPL